MKAAVINKFGPPEVFEIAEIPEVVPGKNEVLIRTISGSINPVDWKQRHGNHRFIFGSPFPIVLGYDVAGIVERTGENVNEFKPGDQVCGVLDNKYGGGLSEFCKSPSHCFVKVPGNLALPEMAALPLAGLTALKALRDKGKIKEGKKVMIIGAAGGVGHFAVQIAAIYKADIVAVSSEPHKQFINNLARVNFVDYRKENILKLSEQFDIIFDTVGKYSFLKCKHLLSKKGIYINTLPRPKILFHKIPAFFTNGKKVKTLLMRPHQNDLKLLTGWVEDGRLKICIDKEFGIKEISNAHAYSESGRAQGKILVKYTW